MQRDPLFAVFEGLLSQPTGYESGSVDGRLDAAFDQGAERIGNAGVSRMQTVSALQQARQAEAPRTLAKVGYNPTTKRFWAFDQELPQDYSALAALAESPPEEIPDVDMPAGYVPLTQEQLGKFLAGIESEADFGAFGSSLAEGVGAIGDAVGAAVGADESWNPWKGAGERHRQSQSLEQQKSHHEGGLGSIEGFGTAASQGLGSAAPVIGTGVVGSVVGTPATGLAAATAVGAAMGAGSQADAARDRLWGEVRSLDDETLQQNSPYYAQLRGEGISEVEAKEALVRRGTRAAAVVGGALAVPETLIGGALLGNLARRVGLGALAGRAGRFADAVAKPRFGGVLGAAANTGIRGTLAGTAEGLQEVAETAFAQAAAGSATGVGPADAGSFASYDDFQAGAPVGFLFGALGGRGRAAAGAPADPLAELRNSDIGAATAGAVGDPDVSAAPAPDISDITRQANPAGTTRDMPREQQVELIQRVLVERYGPQWANNIDAIAQQPQGRQLIGQLMGIEREIQQEAMAAQSEVQGRIDQRFPKSADPGSPTLQGPAFGDLPPQPAIPGRQGALGAAQQPQGPTAAPPPQQREQAVQALLQLAGATDVAQLEPIMPQLQQIAMERADAGDPGLQQLLDASGLVAIPIAPTPEQQAASAAQAQQTFASMPTAEGPPQPQRSPGAGTGIGPRGREVMARVRGPQSAQAAAVRAQLPMPEPVAAPSERTPDGRPVGVAPAPLENPEPMSDLEREGRAASNAELAQRTGVSETTAEPEGDVAAQVAALVDPKNPKDAVFLAEGTTAPAKLPKGVQVVARPGVGTLLTTNAGKASRFKTKAKLTDKDMATILGYPEDKASVQRAGSAVAVEAKDPAGNVVASAVASPKGRQATEKAIGAQAPAGGRVEVSSPQAAQQGRVTRAQQLRDKAKAAPKVETPAPAPSPAKQTRAETIKAASRKKAAEKEAPKKDTPKPSGRERRSGAKRRIKITPKDDKRRPEGIDLEVESVEAGARRDAIAYQQEQRRLGGPSLVPAEVEDIFAEAREQRQLELDDRVANAETALLEKARKEDPAAVADLDLEKREKGTAGPKPKSVLDIPLLPSELTELFDALSDQLTIEGRLIRRGQWSGSRSVMRRVLEAALGQGRSSDLDARAVRNAIAKMADATAEERAETFRMLRPLLRQAVIAKQIVRGADVVAAVQVTPADDVAFDMRVVGQTDLKGWEDLPDTVAVGEPLPRVLPMGKTPKGMAKVLNEWLQLMGIETPVRLLDMKAAVKLHGQDVAFDRNTLGKFFTLDGVPHIAIDFDRYDGDVTIEVLAHEFGHLLQRAVFDRQSPEAKRAVMEAFDRWVQAQGKKTPHAAMLSRSPAALAELFAGRDPANSTITEEYALAFGEWFADNVARWATTSKKPQSVIDKVFAEIAKALREFHSWLVKKEYLPDSTLEAWLDGWVQQAATKAANAKLDEATFVADSFDDGRTARDEPPAQTPGSLLRAKRVAEQFSQGKHTEAMQEALGGIAELATGRAPATGAAREWGGRTLLSFSTLRDIERRYRDRPGWGKTLSTWVDLQFRKAQVALKALEKFSAAMEGAERLSARGRDLLQQVMLDATTGNFHPDVPFDDKKNQHLRSGEPRVVAANRARHARGAALYEQLKAERGDKAYKALRDTYAELHAEMRKRQRKNIDESGLSEEAKAEALRMFDRADQRQVQGPYFPLMRFGDWIVRAKVPPRGVLGPDDQPFQTRAAADTEAKIQKAQNPHATVRVEATDDGYVVRVSEHAVYFFETEAAARAARPQIEADMRQAYDEEGVGYDDAAEALGDKDPIIGNPMRKVEHYEQMKAVPNGFLAEIRQQAAAGKISADVAAEFEQLAIEALPEYSFRKSTLPRQNIRGASQNMLAAYAMRASGAAHSYAMAVHGREISKAWTDLEKARKAADADSDIGVVLDQLGKSQKRLADRTQPTTFNAVTNVISDVTSMFSLAFSPAYALTNAMQPAIVTTPVLAALNGKDGEAIGWAKAAKYMGDAYGGTPGFFIGGRAPKDFMAEFRRFFGAESSPEDMARDATQMIVDKFGKTPAEKDMLRALLDRGTLDFSFLNSLHDAMRMGKVGQKWGALLRMGMAFPQQIEAMNRVVTSLAAYRIATKEMGMDATEATRFADDLVARTQLDYSRLNRPSAFNMPLGFLLQFKLYLQGMYSLMVTAGAKAMNKSLPAAERKEAARTLGYFLISHMAVGGIAGLGPVGWGAKMALGMLAMAFGDDDDQWLSNEALTERVTRDLATEILGEDAGDVAASALLRGLPTLIGIDMADRIGLPMIVDTRYMDLREDDTGASTMNKALVYALGAPWATGQRLADLVSYSAQGEFEEAAKRGLPSALRNAVRAGLWTAEGVTDRDGDVFKPRADLSAADLFATAMGFSSADVNRAYAQRSAEYDTSAKIASARSKLVQRYRNADPDDRDAAREAIAEFNAAVPRPFQIRSDQLRRSVDEKAKRERGELNREQRAARRLVTGE